MSRGEAARRNARMFADVPAAASTRAKALTRGTNDDAADAAAAGAVLADDRAAGREASPAATRVTRPRTAQAASENESGAARSGSSEDVLPSSMDTDAAADPSLAGHSAPAGRLASDGGGDCAACLTSTAAAAATVVGRAAEAAGAHVRRWPAQQTAERISNLPSQTKEIARYRDRGCWPPRREW